MAKQGMINKIAKLESNQTSKSDNKPDKGKGKAKQVQLIHWLEPNPLLNRIESLESYRMKGFYSALMIMLKKNLLGLRRLEMRTWSLLVMKNMYDVRYVLQLQYKLPLYAYLICWTGTFIFSS